MTYFLEPVTLETIKPLLEEVESTQAYVWRSGDTPPFLYDLLAEFAGEPLVRCFAIRDATDGQMAGFITTLPGDTPGTLEVGPLYIRPAYRGRGWGQRALEDLIRWVGAQGVPTLFIQTWGANARARHVFERVGFQFVGEIPNARVNGDSTVTFSLPLRDAEGEKQETGGKKQGERLAGSRYVWILFDADGTLFDYDAGERTALSKTLPQFGFDFVPAHLDAYRSINERVWHDFEQGLTTQERLKVERFELLFETCKLEPAPNATVFSARYLENLGTCSDLLDDVEQVIQALRGKLRLALITNGLGSVQRPRLRGSVIGDAFSAVIISEEVGCSKPDPAIFDVAFRQMGDPCKDEVLIVGDSLSADIQGGLAYGIDTCWINREGKPASDAVTPRYEIRALFELLNILAL
ncbi:MAG: YjjG family noncanonical pyrimidine nucleotidase [Anaerolineae bacterium]|nr:YjjG family noncanonical pyrimidine nucleotidase [Anaerolineae bacterium]